MEQELRLRIKQTVDSSEIEALHQEMLKVKKDIMDLQALGREKDAFAIADKKKDLLDLRDSLRKAKEILRDVNKEAKLDLKMQGQNVVLGSIEAIQMKLVFLNNEIKKVNPNSDAFLILGQKIAQAEKEMMVAGARLHQTTAGAANMSTAMLNLNYVVRDSPYFFNNFAMGVMAIGNNLNPLIDSMIRARTEANALGSTFGKELLKVLAGPAGVIFFFSIAVAAFQAITFAMSKSKREAESLGITYAGLSADVAKLKKEQDELNKSIENLSIEETITAIGNLTAAIAKQREEVKRAIEAFKSYETSRPSYIVAKDPRLEPKVISEEEKKKIALEEELNLKFRTATKAQELAGESLLKWTEQQKIHIDVLGKVKKELEDYRKSNELTEDQTEANIKAQKNINEALKIYDERLKNLGDKPADVSLNLDLSTLEGLENLIKEAREGLEKVKFDSKDFDIALEKWNTLKDELERREFEIKLKTENFEELFPELVEIARANFTTDLNELLGVDDFEKEFKEVIKNLTKDFEDYAKERTDAIKDSTQFLQDLQIENIEDETERRIASIKQWRDEQLFAYRESEGERLDLVQEFADLRREIERRANQEIIQAQRDEYRDLITSSANILESEFKQAWREVFGEANSLVEKLFQNMMAKLAEMAAAKIFGFILDMVLPGAGSILSTILSSQSTNILSEYPNTFQAHSGKLMPDEGWVLAKEGEMFLTKKQQANLWETINNPKPAQSQDITIPLTVQIGDEIVSKMIYKKLPAVYQTLTYEGYL